MYTMRMTVQNIDTGAEATMHLANKTAAGLRQDMAELLLMLLENTIVTACSSRFISDALPDDDPAKYIPF